MSKGELKQMVERGFISLRSAAFELKRMGNTDYVPNDREVIHLLHIVI